MPTINTNKNNRGPSFWFKILSWVCIGSSLVLLPLSYSFLPQPSGWFLVVLAVCLYGVGRFITFFDKWIIQNARSRKSNQNL